MAGNAARAKAIIKWLGALTITEGPRAGERFEVLPFQRRFVRGLVANAEAGLSVGRGCGKTTLAAALAACATAGPLAAVRAQTIIVASSLGQARIAFNHARWFLRPILERDPKRWRVIEHSHECRIEDRRTGTNLRALGSDPRRAHGLAPKLVIADEPAQWPVNHGQRMHAALVTALGKHEAAKFIAIGTRPEDERHWFARMLGGGPGVYAQVHAAPEDADDFLLRSIRRANPSLDHMPALRAALVRERDKAREFGGADLAMWRALRLNKGTPEVGECEVIVTVDNWQACVFAVPPPREGPVVIGFDLGGSASMSAFGAYWPRTGRLEVRGAFPADPGLAARGAEDGVGDRYVRMAERGEILTYPGKVTPPGRFLTDMAATLVGQDVIGAVADRYRKTEAEQALGEADIRWPIEWRATGAGKDGSADIRAFQAEVLEAHLRTAPSLLMDSAIAECKIGRDTNGNPRLDKSRRRGRIDALQAVVLAVGLGRRWRLPSLDTEVNPLLDHYESGAPLVIGSV
ncbi:terminase large subunit domain-containing protein [Candidatus Palauibacter sp.]|uniref:terminase large subunit domain-containing protein n=1 Tax=Candidatus Palauibacter sp. TaxID=3101350 RepID=UPI003CC59023